MNSQRFPRWSVRAVVFCAAALATPLSAQYAELASRAPDAFFFGLQGSQNSTVCALSEQGRFVAFQSDATNLVADDSNGVADIFVLDRDTGRVERVSVSTSGEQGDGASRGPSITPDGRFIVFQSDASNLVPGDGNGRGDVFLHDRVAGTTVRAGVADSEAEAPNGTSGPSVSDDGTRVAFASADPLVAGDGNGEDDIFVRDLLAGTTTRVSLDSAGNEGNDASFQGLISGDGMVVAFESNASNLVAGDGNGHTDVFVRDLSTGAVSRIAGLAGADPDDRADVWGISRDGSVVVFSSRATNFVAGDANGDQDVFAYDDATGLVALVSAAAGGGSAGGFSQEAAIGADGRFVAFRSDADDIVVPDTNPLTDIFVHDLDSGTIVLASQTTAGMQPEGAATTVCLSGDGNVVGLASDAELVADDDNLQRDVFVRDLSAITTERVSLADLDGPFPVYAGNDGSSSASLSGDGRFLALDSSAENLTGAPASFRRLIYRIDLVSRDAVLVSPAFGGGAPDDSSDLPSISASGERIAFESRATNLVAIDTNGSKDVFLRDIGVGATRRVSVDSAGVEADGDSDAPSIAADGSAVAFASTATNLVASDGNGLGDVFVHQVATGVTTRVSVSSGGLEGNAPSDQPAISADGRYVVFRSEADNLVAGDGNGDDDIFRHDRLSGVTERVSVGLGGGDANAASSWPSISANGRFVAFASSASNLVAGDVNGVGDVFVRDMLNGITLPVSLSPSGAPFSSRTDFPRISADGSVVTFIELPSGSSLDRAYAHLIARGETRVISRSRSGAAADAEAAAPAVSGDGSRVAFESLATNLDPRDRNGKSDVFIAEMDALFDDSFERF